MQTVMDILIKRIKNEIEPIPIVGGTSYKYYKYSEPTKIIMFLYENMNVAKIYVNVSVEVKDKALANPDAKAIKTLMGDNFCPYIINK